MHKKKFLAMKYMRCYSYAKYGTFLAPRSIVARPYVSTYSLAAIYVHTRK